MLAFYAAVTSIQDGSLAEAELEYWMTSDDEEHLIVTLRREVRTVTENHFDG